MNFLFVGDVFGSLGRKVVEQNIPKIRKEHNIDFVIVNGENIAHGKGITEKHYKWLMSLGVHVVTMGNHTFDNKNIFEFMNSVDKLIVPINYEDDVPGKGLVTTNINGRSVTVISLMGRYAINIPLKNPFYTIDEVLKDLKSDIIIVDFHAEGTSEKIAMAHYLDGRVDAVVGTHTHVATADARILPKGTVYQTDVGMNGPLNGVIGVKIPIIVENFKTGLPRRFEPLEEGAMQFNALVFSVGQNKKVIPINKTFTN